MRYSADRMLTTHSGSLPRPQELTDMLLRQDAGELGRSGRSRLPTTIADAVATAVGRQFDIGIDVITDGEMSKSGFATYVKERLTGFGGLPERLRIADLADYPEAAARLTQSPLITTPSCDGPVSYVGHAAVVRDVANLGDVLDQTRVEAFLPAASPGVIAYTLQNRYYPDRASYLAALADAMRSEYEAIAGAGFLLQIDAPDLAGGRHIEFADLTVPAFRTRLAENVAALNDALRTIPPEQVRVHVCWGNYPGPHHRDIPLRDIADLVFETRAHAIVLEAANPRHEHEWRLFEETTLPDDKILIPGVIDTNTTYIEHPELVAERIIRYAALLGRDRVIAGTDCGFATTSTLMTIPPGIVWAKLATLVEGAQLATAALYP